MYFNLPKVKDRCKLSAGVVTAVAYTSKGIRFLAGAKVYLIQ